MLAPRMFTSMSRPSTLDCDTGAALDDDSVKVTFSRHWFDLLKIYAFALNALKAVVFTVVFAVHYLHRRSLCSMLNSLHTNESPAKAL